VQAALSDNPEVRARMVSEMAQQMAGELGVELEAEAAADLADLVNGELTRARTELEKLAAYVGERKRITPADVDLLVVSEKKYSVWQLADMLAGRQRDRALEFLSGVLREGEEPAGIVGALVWMYRKLIQAQELPRNISVWDATRQLGIRKDTAETALRQARRIPREQLLSGLRALYDADSGLKSGAFDRRAILEFLLASLTASPAAVSRR
jgi:DNA polymerase-3 subunit delta